MTGGKGASAETGLTPTSSSPERRISASKMLQVPGAAGLLREDRDQIVEVTEKHGILYNAIPSMPLSVAILCCIFNIIVPGLGTFVSAWTTLCGCKTGLGAPAKAFGLNILSAFLQMVSFVLIVGWVWSIIWGMNFVQISVSAGKPQKTPYYVRRQSSVE